MHLISRAALTCLMAAPFALSIGGFAETAPGVTLTIHAQQVKAKSSPTLYGLMTEEINYSYDGGLYGELVRNRMFFSGGHGVPSWRLVQYGEAKASMGIDRTTGPSAAQPYSMEAQRRERDGERQGGVGQPGILGNSGAPENDLQGIVLCEGFRRGGGAGAD